MKPVHETVKLLKEIEPYVSSIRLPKNHLKKYFQCATGSEESDFSVASNLNEIAISRSTFLTQVNQFNQYIIADNNIDQLVVNCCVVGT